MANPAIFTCTANTWVKVATAVTSATLHKRSNEPNVYKQTFRLTAEAAPTDDSDAALLFAGGGTVEQISNDVAIDVYVKAVGVDGEVRTDA